MNKAFYILTVLFYLLLFALVCLQGITLNETQELVAEYSNKVEAVRNELQESEARCQRMTDTCIKILSEGAWQ